MNDRIQQLALQAGYTKDMLGVGHWDMPECKKFAELIVRECIHQCKKDMVSDEDVVEGYDEDWNMALKHGVEQIRKHFGVEE